MDCHTGACRIINRLCPLTQSIERDDELSARNATATAEVPGWHIQQFKYEEHC
ncbi:hypothetical protein PILCRDRAFT_822516 [Piloderma croceum F 1598]|uniref:Uncharacterized protein n=1 Tax=Piloderma croceum (strain F 1598) TaxID=765440 RepID=A0A0C3FKC4_PILCF|nr:hypothetical protein PILCRDRAFT_822516 [Piloderma croceum F 1598]